MGRPLIRRHLEIPEDVFGHHSDCMKLQAVSAQGCIGAMCVTVPLYKEFSLPKCQTHPH